MRSALLATIVLYWKIVPPHKRRKCIYKHSCSNYVYEQTKMFGFMAGLKAVKYRAVRCNSGFQFFNNPITGRVEIILSTGDVLTSDEIAERLSEMSK